MQLRLATLRHVTFTLCCFTLCCFTLCCFTLCCFTLCSNISKPCAGKWTPHYLNPPAGCSGRLFWSKDPLGELRGWVGVCAGQNICSISLSSPPALWLVAGLSGPTPSIANHLPTWREGSRVANFDPARGQGVRAGTALLG